MVAPPPPPRRSRADRAASGCIVVVIAVAIAQIFVRAPQLSVLSGAALALYFALTWRRFTFAAWVPVILSAVLVVAAVCARIPAQTLAEAVDRMAFLSSLLALLGMLRVVAASAPEIAQAGSFLTAQPPGRRYLAMAAGGHIFGLLINLGGLAILLEMARRSLDRASPPLPDWAHEVKLRRMTTATLRGFSLIPMWSPFGFGINALLLAMPGLRYGQIGPIGGAGAILFLLWGWLLDWHSRPPRQAGTVRSVPPPGAGQGVLILIGHVSFLGGTVVALNVGTGLGFQQALLMAVPLYALGWAASASRRPAPGAPRISAGDVRTGAAAAMGRTLAQTVRNFPLAAAEIGVFASAGLLSVLALALIPVDHVQAWVAAWGLTGWQAVVMLNVALFGLATLGVNPIISASILGALVTQLHLPGLSLVAAALALAGAWSTVMGFTPFITTVAFSGALIGRRPAQVGIGWNGLYAVSTFVLWTAGLALAVSAGLI